MEGYKRAYRDSTSPLTPLTPMLGNLFNFDVNEANQSLVPANQSPLCAGIAALGSLIQRDRGHGLGSAPTGTVRRRTRSNKENTPMSTVRALPPARQKLGSADRAIVKQEKLDTLPRINIEPPSKRRDCKKFSRELKSNNSDDFDIVELSGDTDFVLKQQEQLEHYSAQTKGRRFDASNVRLASPVVPRPLSPRLGAFLASWGMNCLNSIFERQEIDIETFCCLTADDLALLGIEDAAKRELVLKAVDFLKNKLRK